MRARHLIRGPAATRIFLQRLFKDSQALIETTTTTISQALVPKENNVCWIEAKSLFHIFNGLINFTATVVEVSQIIPSLHVSCIGSDGMHQAINCLFSPAA